jgi:hypothetical protein
VYAVVVTTVTSWPRAASRSEKAQMTSSEPPTAGG